MAWRFPAAHRGLQSTNFSDLLGAPEGAPALDSTHDPAYCSVHSIFKSCCPATQDGSSQPWMDVLRRGAPTARQGASASVPLAPPDGAHSLRFWPTSIRPELPYPSRQPLMGNGTSNTGPADALPVAHRWLRTRMETRCTKHPASLSPGPPGRGCVGTVLKAVNAPSTR